MQPTCTPTRIRTQGTRTQGIRALNILCKERLRSNSAYSADREYSPGPFLSVPRIYDLEIRAGHQNRTSNQHARPAVPTAWLAEKLLQ